MPVVNVERIADSTNTLAIQTRAVKFGNGFTLTPYPGNSLSGTPGAPGQVTGYVQVDYTGGGSSNPTFGTVTATQINLGNYYQMGAGVSGTMPGSGGSAVTIGQWTVLPGKTIRIEGRIILEAPVAGFGLLDCNLASHTVIKNAGAGPVVAESYIIGNSGTVPPFGGSSGVLATTVSGNVVTSAILPLTIPAWAAGAVVGSLLGNPPNSAPNPPTAMQGSTGNTVVTHSSLIYICTVGGTASIAPTGTGGPITPGDGTTWYEVGSASAGIGFSYVAAFAATVLGV